MQNTDEALADLANDPIKMRNNYESIRVKYLSRMVDVVSDFIATLKRHEQLKKRLSFHMDSTLGLMPFRYSSSFYACLEQALHPLLAVNPNITTDAIKSIKDTCILF